MDVPEPLYKYTTHKTASIILNSGKLRWSSPLLFNDLAEFQRMPRFEPTLEDSLAEYPRVLVNIATGDRNVDESKLSPLTYNLLVAVRLLIKSGMSRDDIITKLRGDSFGADDKMSAAISAFFNFFGLNSVRVCCLTTEFNNDVMWAHYAENHRGIVLGFRHIRSLDTPFLAAKPVEYSSEPPVIGSGLDLLVYGHDYELQKRTVNAVCYAKSLKWQYENEWRVVTWRQDEIGKDYGDYGFYPDELESVCFGARFDHKYEVELTSLVYSRYPKCNLYRMVTEHGKSRRLLLT